MKKLLLGLGLVSMLTLTACGQDVIVKDASDLEHTISVSGQATEEIAPDVAYLNVNVLVEEKDSKLAQGKAATIMDSLFKNLKELGVNKEDISTTDFRVDFIRDYSYHPVKPLKEGSSELPNGIIGYSVQNQVKITINDINKISEIIDAVSGINNVSVHNLDFSIKDIEKAKNQITQKAIENAKEQANSIASSLDVKVSGVQKVEVSNVSNPYGRELMNYSMAKAESMDVSTPISPEEVKLNAQVQVTFLIEN